MPFKIIFVDHDKYQGEEIAREDAKILASIECDDAKEAETIIRAHKEWCARNGFTPAKLRIQKIVTAAWEEREAKRLQDGTYTPLPDWWLNSWWWIEAPSNVRKHFTHMAEKNPGKIAFTESPEKGEADIQLVISPTTYLSRFFGNVLGSREIRDLGSMFMVGDYTLKTSMLPEDFEDVYERAENVCGDGSDSMSCMRYTRDTWDLEHHPAYAYGAGDLAIAWIEDENEVLGRAVIWPEKKTYVRVYGTNANYQSLMHTLLKREGYTHVKDMTGARLLKIDVTDEDNTDNCKYYLMPYLDNRDSRYIEDAGTHFVMTEDRNNQIADCTEGVFRVWEYVTCAKTGRRVPANRTVTVDGETWCEYYFLRNQDNLYYCDVTNMWTQERTQAVLNSRYNRMNMRQSLIDAMRTFMCERLGVLVDASVWEPIQVITRYGTQTWANCDRTAYRQSREDGLYYARDYYPNREVTSDLNAVEARVIAHSTPNPATRSWFESEVDWFVRSVGEDMHLPTVDNRVHDGTNPDGAVTGRFFRYNREGQTLASSDNRVHDSITHDTDS